MSSYEQTLGDSADDADDNTVQQSRTFTAAAGWRRLSAIMTQIRCPKCNRMLGYFEGKGEMECPRCRKHSIVCFDTDSRIVKMKTE